MGELSVKVPIHSDHLDDTFYISGRIDYYTYNDHALVDVKVTGKLEWQVSNGFVPRAWDILQVQCYDTMTQAALNTKKLILLYIDLNISVLRAMPFSLHLSTNASNSGLVNFVETTFMSTTVYSFLPSNIKDQP